MTSKTIVAILSLLFTQASIAPSLQEQANIGDKTFVEKIAAARVSNTYVHFTKGGDAHCLFDPTTKNAVPLTIFQDRKLDEVKLYTSGRDSVLKDTTVHSFEIGNHDFYAIYKNRKIIVANTVTGQTGVIILAEPETK